MARNTVINKNTYVYEQQEKYDQLEARALVVAQIMSETEPSISKAFINNVHYLMSINDPCIESFIHSREIGLNNTEMVLPKLDDDSYSF